MDPKQDEHGMLDRLDSILRSMVGHLDATQAHQKQITDTLVAQSKRDRFWRNIRAGVYLVAVIAVPLFYASILVDPFEKSVLNSGYAALVKVDGTIASNERSSALKVVNALEKAFADKAAKGVVVLINSPGGSPVQSSIIRNRLKSLRAEYPNTKVWAVGEDMLTSGAYYIATGSDQICVNPATMTGSIGVISEGFGLQDIASKYGVERRIYTAGDNKHRMDMFKRVEPQDEKKLETILSAVHKQFIDAVRDGRGDRLALDRSPELFSGDYWTGEDALKLGLADRLCDLPSLLKEEFAVAHVKDYTLPASIFAGLSSSIGAEVRETVLPRLEGPAQLLPW